MVHSLAASPLVQQVIIKCWISWSETSNIPPDMAYSPQDVYARHLVSCCGYLLWMPKPNMNLPDVYVQEGSRLEMLALSFQNMAVLTSFSTCANPLHICFTENLVCPTILPPFYSVEEILPSSPKLKVQAVSFLLPQWQGWGIQMSLIEIQQGVILSYYKGPCAIFILTFLKVCTTRSFELWIHTVFPWRCSPHQ